MKIEKIPTSLRSLGVKRFVHDISMPPRQERIGILSGAGGRSSNNGKVATVFGCGGSVGRYVVNKLARQGHQVIVPYRAEEGRVKDLKLMGDLGQIVPMEFDLRNYDQLVECVRHSDLVVNLMGRFWESRNFSFDEVHNKGAARVAQASRECGVGRLIHFSALNADEESPSEFYASKGRGEKSVTSIFPEATIIRPATTYGTEDYFLNRIGRSKHWHITVDYGQRIHHPVNSHDVALAIDIITRDTFSYNGKVFELVGPQKLTYAQIIDHCSEVLKQDIKTINFPPNLLKSFLKLVHYYPYRCLRPEEIPLMLIDDKIHPDTLKFEHLGIVPQALQHCILSIMRMYRINDYYELGYDTKIPKNAVYKP